MRKFLPALVASLILFGGQADVEAASVEQFDTQAVETQEMSGKWAHFRDKYLLDRETDRDRRKRKERERRHRHDYDYDYYDRHDRYDPPRHGSRYGPPPPPPRHGSRYGPPPPPRDYYYDPPPPPRRGYPPPPPTRYR